MGGSITIGGHKTKINAMARYHISFLFFLLALPVMFFSCGNEEINVAADPDNFNFEIKAGEPFRYVLSEYISIEGGYKIISHPKNKEVSEIKWTERGMEYFYTPPRGFKGYDEVSIEYCESPGDSSCSNVYELKLRFIVQ